MTEDSYVLALRALLAKPDPKDLPIKPPRKLVQHEWVQRVLHQCEREQERAS